MAISCLYLSLFELEQRADTRIERTQPLNYIRHRIIQAILQKERQSRSKKHPKVPLKWTSAFWGYK